MIRLSWTSQCLCYHWLWRPSLVPLPQKIPHQSLHRNPLQILHQSLHQNPLQIRQILPQTSSPPWQQLWLEPSHRWSSLQQQPSLVPRLQMTLPRMSLHQNLPPTSGKRCQLDLGYLVGAISLGSSRMNLIDIHCFRGFFLRARVLVGT